MIISKEYLTTVLPKAVAIVPKRGEMENLFLVTCEQRAGGNYCDHAEVPESEMMKTFMHGLVAPELVLRLQQALEWLPLVPGIPNQFIKDIESTLERSAKAAAGGENP